MQNTKLNVSSERRFGTKEVIALLIIPLTMLLAYALTYTPFVQNQWIGTLWSVGAKLIALAVILRLFGNVFKQDRQTFKQNKLNFVRCLLGFGLILGVLFLSKAAIKPFLLTTRDDLYGGTNMLLILIASLSPLAAPFIEELVFRHLLMYKFRNHTRVVLIGAIIISSILFGVMHYVNFNALLPTVPYMVIGAVFCGIYLFFKNIWFSTIIHLLFNAMNSIGAVLLLLFLQLTQG